MTFRASLADRKNKKREEGGEAIVAGERCPGQACDLLSSLRWLTFGAAGDKESTYLFAVRGTTAWYKGLSDKHSKHDHLMDVPNCRKEVVRVDF